MRPTVRTTTTKLDQALAAFTDVVVITGLFTVAMLGFISALLVSAQM